MLSKDEIEERKPIWHALSEFYLDTELQESEINSIAQTFVRSGYTIKEIQEIEYNEVLPVLGWNAIDVAGVWQGFEKEWLNTKIIEHLRKPKSKVKQFFLSLFYKDTVKMTAHYWHSVQKYIDASEAKITS